MTKPSHVLVLLAALTAASAHAEPPRAVAGPAAERDNSVFKDKAARFALLATSHIVCDSEGYSVDPAAVRVLGLGLIKQGTDLGLNPQASEDIVTSAIGAQMAADKARMNAMPDGAEGSAAFDAYWQPRCASLATDPAFSAYMTAKKP